MSAGPTVLAVENVFVYCCGIPSFFLVKKVKNLETPFGSWCHRDMHFMYIKYITISGFFHGEAQLVHLSCQQCALQLISFSVPAACLCFVSDAGE